MCAMTGARPPEIPDILLNWHMDLHLDIVTMSASPRSRKFVVMKEAQVQDASRCFAKLLSVATPLSLLHLGWHEHVQPIASHLVQT